MTLQDSVAHTRPTGSPAGGRKRATGSREHLPVSIFAVVMGLAGSALAWHRAASTLHVPLRVGQVLASGALVTVHPAWFIPVVGNLVVPLAGVAHAPLDVSWFFFAIGIVYWLPLLAIVLNRLVLGGIVLAVMSLLVAGLAARTLLAVYHGEICRPE